MFKPKVAIIGAGIFGVNSAVELNAFCDVELIEAAKAPLLGATFANHNRHHFGFHYPRSTETARQCIDSAASFMEIFGDSLVWDFDNFYCVSKNGSHISGEEYLAFLHSVGVEFEIVKTPETIINPDKIVLCLRAKEPVCDYIRLRDLALQRLDSIGVQPILNSSVVSGGVDIDDRKYLTLVRGGEEQRRHYDIIINAMYANSNLFCEWFQFKPRLFQFNLQELDILEIPTESSRQFGVTIMDGMYPSILPYGRTGHYIMAHAEASQLKRESSFERIPLLRRQLNIESNWEQIREASLPYLPILNKATYKRSIYVDRVIDSTRSGDDARVTEITEHGNGCWSIFAAKVITCVSTSRKLADLVRKSIQ